MTLKHLLLVAVLRCEEESTILASTRSQETGIEHRQPEIRQRSMVTTLKLTYVFETAALNTAEY